MENISEFNKATFLEESLKDMNPVCVPDSSPNSELPLTLDEVGNTNVLEVQELDKLQVDEGTADRILSFDFADIPGDFPSANDFPHNFFHDEPLMSMQNKQQQPASSVDDFVESLLATELQPASTTLPSSQPMQAQPDGNMQSSQLQRVPLNTAKIQHTTDGGHSAPNNGKSTKTKGKRGSKRKQSQPPSRNDNTVGQRERTRKRARTQPVPAPVAHGNRNMVSNNPGQAQLDVNALFANGLSPDQVAMIIKNAQQPQCKSNVVRNQPPPVQHMVPPMDTPGLTVNPNLRTNNNTVNPSANQHVVLGHVSIPNAPGTTLRQLRNTPAPNHYVTNIPPRNYLEKQPASNPFDEIRLAVRNLAQVVKKVARSCNRDHQFGAGRNQLSQTERANSVNPTQISALDRAVAQISRYVDNAARLHNNSCPQREEAIPTAPTHMNIPTHPQINRNQPISFNQPHTQQGRHPVEMNHPPQPTPRNVRVAPTNFVQSVKDVRFANHNGTVLQRNNEIVGAPIVYKTNPMPNMSRSIPQHQPMPNMQHMAHQYVMNNTHEMLQRNNASQGGSHRNVEAIPPGPSSYRPMGDIAGPSSLTGEVLKRAMGEARTDDEIQPAEMMHPDNLVRKTPAEVRNLLGAQDGSTVERVKDYWESFEDFHLIPERLQKRLKEKGIKLERRKRMGPEVPAEEKKAIRAQRNRERSQALRRHHKERMKDLEVDNGKLQNYNEAMKSLIHCLLAEEESPPLVKEYFKEPENVEESFLDFLRKDEQEKDQQPPS